MASLLYISPIFDRNLVAALVTVELPKMERCINLRGKLEVFSVGRGLACGVCCSVCSGCRSSFGSSYDGSRGIGMYA